MIKKLLKLFTKKKIDAIRACWNCNASHEHLKQASYKFVCLECGKVFYKGKEV